MLALHSPAVAIGGLAFLTLFLVYLRARFGSVLRPLREQVGYRVIIAAVAGWLGAWVYLPEGLFPGPVDTLGWFLPGTLFGLLVLVPLLDDPVRQWPRGLLLLWATAIAHATLWITGYTTVILLNDAGWEWLESSDSGILQSTVLGVPSGIAFGAIVAVAASRVLRMRMSLFIWILVFVISAVCGIVYADAVAADGLGHLLDWLPLDDAHVYFAYVAWYAAMTAVLAAGRMRPTTTSKRVDVVLLAGLVILSVYTGYALDW